MRTALAWALLGCGTALGQTTVDDFATAQAVLQVPPGSSSSSVAAGAGLLGGERDLRILLRTGVGPVTAGVAGGTFDFSTGAGTLGEAEITWDGVDGDAGNLDPTGLGGLNLGAGATALRVSVLSATAGAELVVEVVSDGQRSSVRAVILPGIAVPTLVDLPFSSFAPSLGAGADFADIGAVTLRLRGTAASLSLGGVEALTASPVVTATKTDGVAAANPGDVLSYSLTLGNTGGGDAGTVALADTLDPNTTLVVGSIEVSPLARDDAYVGAVVDIPFAAPAPGLLGNDVDGDGDPLAVAPIGSRATTRGGAAVVAADGAFTYTPPAGFLGVDTFTYQADDGNGIPGPGMVTVIVGCPTITIDTSTLADGTVSVAYGPVTLTATGASGVLTWTVTGVPNGMTFSASGDLGGTPIQTGSFSPTFTATDGLACAGSATIPLTIACGGMTVDPATLPDGVAGTPYSQTVTQTGGVGTTTFSVTTGTLPAGLTLDSPSGLVSGTPTTPNPYTFTITATDSNACTASRPYTVTIVCPAIDVTPATLTNGLEDAAYLATLDGTGGTAPYGFAVTAGALPPGVTLGPLGGFSGAPTVPGTYNFTVTATDANGCGGSRAYALVVDPVNDAPAFTAGPSQTVLEDSGPQTVAGWATGMTSGPPDEAGQTLTFVITSNSNPGLFSLGPVVDASTGTLSYTPAADAFGVASIQIGLQDNGGTLNGGVDLSAPQAFSITVTGVNDAPTFTVGPNLTVAEDAAAQSIAAWTAPSAGPGEAGQTLTFVVVSNDNPSLFSAGPTVSGTGTLTYTPAANLNGVANLSVRLQDNGGTANGGVDTSAAQAFSITVTAVNDPPVALPKTFAAQANMTVVGLGGLLGGATDPDTGTSGCTTSLVVANVTPVVGGTVSNLNPGAGTFDFSPTPGFSGAASLTYQVLDDGCPGPGVSSVATAITINVAGPVIWFVDNTNAGAANGMLGSPFMSLAAATAAIGASVDHKIFLHTGTGTYAGGASLNTDGWLIGQGVAGSFDAVFGIAPPAGTAARPQVNGTRPAVQSTVTLGTSSRLQGVNLAITTAATSGVVASGKTGLVVNEVTVSTTTGTAVNLANSGGAIVLTSVSSNGAPNGINLLNTTGSFEVTGDGASDPTNLTRGRTTARSGGGTLVLGSGGTIQNSSGVGALLVNATNVTLRNLTVQNGGNDGVNADTSTNLTLDNVLVTGHAGARGLRAQTLTGLGLQHTEISNNATNVGVEATSIANVDFGTRRPCAPCGEGLKGTATVANSLFQNARENLWLHWQASASTLAMTVTNSGFETTAIGAGLNVTAWDTADVSWSVSGSLFQGIRTSGFSYGGNDGSGGGTISVTSNSFVNVGVDTNVGHQGLGKTVTLDLSGNTTKQSLVAGSSTSLGALTGGVSNATTLLRGTMSNNLVGNAAVTDSGSDLGPGMAVEARGAGTVTLGVRGNVVRQVKQDAGFLASANSGSGRLNLTLNDNDFQVNTAAAFPYAGVDLISGGAGGLDSTRVCLNLLKPSAPHNVAFIGGAGTFGIGLSALAASSAFDLQGYAGAANDGPAVTAFLATTAATVNPAPLVANVGTIQAAAAACPVYP